MPSISQGLPMYLSTAANIGTRVKGPAAAGQIADSGTGGPIPSPGGFMCVQSTASVINQVVTTSATGLQNASFVYIPVTTGALTGSTVIPPYLGVGTPLVWNDNSASLMVWSSSRAVWMTQTVTSSALLGDFKGFTSTV